MAGISSSRGFHFKPLLSPSSTTATTTVTKTTTSYHLSLSSSESKAFGLRLLYNHHNSFSFVFSSPVGCSVSARYGGGGRGGGGGRRFNDPRNSSRSSDDDQALDISSIRSDTVRLIDEKQNMVGIVPKGQAIQMADDAELDLVILSADSDPPVVRIMNYNKYKYELQKKKRDQQKKSAATRMDLKELKMGYNIDQHDYSVRLRAAQKFLKDGDKVKIMVNLKGRENDFRNKAIELVRRFQNDVGELATEENKSFHDRTIFIVLVPNKAVLQKAQEPPKRKDKSEVNEVTV